MNPIEQVPAHRWEQWVADNDGVLLDVRQPEEWDLGTLPNAQLLAMSELIDRVGEIPKDKAILCICRSGDRSHQVASYLVYQGYRAANLDGGMHALGLQD